MFCCPYQKNITSKSKIENRQYVSEPILRLAVHLIPTTSAPGVIESNKNVTFLESGVVQSKILRWSSQDHACHLHAL